MEGNRAAKGIKIKGGAFRAFLLLVLIINCAYLQNEILVKQEIKSETNEVTILLMKKYAANGRLDYANLDVDPRYGDTATNTDDTQHHGVKRRLATDPLQSTVTGTGVATFAKGSTVTVTVTSKDSTGALVGVGGDTWIIKVTNECVKANDYACVGVSRAANVLSSAISGQMTDNSDGTYSFSYTVANPGKISVHVYFVSAGGCYVEYNASSNFSGASLGSGIETDISRDYGEGNVASTGRADNVSLKITTTILAPYTGTYTFDFVYDDGADVYLDGTMFLNQLGTPCHCTQSVTKSLVAGTYYPFYAKWGEIGGTAIFTVNWAYDTVSSIQIPTTNQKLTPLGGTSPYKFIVLDEYCGDGKTNGNDKCDDGNNISGDGCSSICNIEDNYICINSSTAKSVCTACVLCWTPDSTKTSCVPDELTSGIYPFSAFYIALLCIGILLCFVLTKFFKYSSYGMYIMFAQFQMFMLTPLIGGFIPKIVIDFYRHMYGMIFNFWFIFDWSVFINFNKTFGNYSYNFNWYLYLISMPSYSALNNMGKLLWIFMWLVTVYIILAVASLIIGLVAKDSWAHKIFKYLFDLMKNKMFMRLFMLSYCFMWLACMTEIGLADNPNDNKNSYIFAIFALVSLIMFLIFAIVVWGISLNPKWYEYFNFTHELFNGMQKNWKSRVFPILSLLRSALFTILVCGAYSKSMYLPLTLMIAFQIVVLASEVIIRPHLHIKDLVVEIANDFVLFLGLVILYYLDRSSRWPNAVSWVYISFLMGCVTLYLGSNLGALGYELWQLDKARKLEMLKTEVKNAIVADEKEDDCRSKESSCGPIETNKIISIPNVMV